MVFLTACIVVAVAVSTGPAKRSVFGLCGEGEEEESLAVDMRGEKVRTEGLWIRTEQRESPLLNNRGECMAYSTCHRMHHECLFRYRHCPLGLPKSNLAT